MLMEEELSKIYEKIASILKQKNSEVAPDDIMQLESLNSRLKGLVFRVDDYERAWLVLLFLGAYIESFKKRQGSTTFRDGVLNLLAWDKTRIDSIFENLLELEKKTKMERLVKNLDKIQQLVAI